MGILSLFSKRASIEDPTVALSKAYDLLVDSPSSSGAIINKRTILGNPAVWRGANLIAQSVAKLPCLVYRRGKDDSRERATSHPAYRLLKKAPSQYYSAYTFKHTLQAHALLYGNGYSYIYRNELGSPVELAILDPELTYPVKENETVWYVTSVEGKQVKLPFADVLHIKGLSYDGLVGWSVLDVMRDALGLGLSLQKYGSVYFRNNGRPSIVIELPPNVRNEETIAEFRKTWGNMHQGLDNAHRPALLRNGAKLTTIGGDNENGQYLQSREHDLIMVADILGLPPHKLGAGIATSYSSLESENRAFLSDSLDGWLTQWEEQLELKLLRETEKAQDSFFIEFERKALVQTDARTETELLVTWLNNGLASWEETRSKINLPTIKDEAQEWRRPANIVVEGEEPAPEPQAPVPEPQDQEQEEEQDQEQDRSLDEALAEARKETIIDLARQMFNAQNRCMSLLRTDVKRLVNRLQRAAESGKLDMRSHSQVWNEALAAFPKAPEVIDRFLSGLEEELQAVLPEQRAGIFYGIDLDKLCEELWS